MWQALYWVGARGNLEDRRWVNLRDGQPLTWHNLTLASSSVTQQYQCILAGGKQFPYEWYHAPCSVSACTVCNFTTYPEIHLRGLCHSSLFDRSLFLHDYFNKQPLFDGAVHSRVAWVNGSWMMESRLYPDLRARMLDQVEYPVGVHKWMVEGDKCRHKEVGTRGTSPQPHCHPSFAATKTLKHAARLCAALCKPLYSHRWSCC